ncbi:MAG: tRNA (guanosine(46)-N7)-methyltransferase TrmB [Gammaproteobacteria bacterium AqS3]|nr:tRNA (guanosine(46)-N7)-methyltransferase TrmB [Gammaproteobacteria bacterium AqS3]
MSERTIRSYVARGRVSRAQRRNIEQLLPKYLAGDDDIAGAEALEIGFGNGDALLAAARAQPERRFIGVEMHTSGLGQAAGLLERDGIGNVRLLRENAAELMQRWPPGALDEIRIWFPDPWPKRRHHKRRLVKCEFLQRCSRALKPGGLLYLASDHSDYAHAMLIAGNHCGGLANANPSGGFAPRFPGRPVTRFEQRGLNKGHRVYDLCYRRV